MSERWLPCTFIAVAAWVLVGFLAACTSADPPSSVSSASPAEQNPESGAATRVVAKTVRLSCADATQSAAPPTGPSTLGGLTLEGVSGDVAGSRPADVGLQVPAGSQLYFAKIPAYLGPGTTGATIELAPDSEGYLAWVPASTWTGGGGAIDLTPWMATTVILDGCPDQASTYLGGVLSPSPHMCLTLRVSQRSEAGQHQDIFVGARAEC